MNHVVANRVLGPRHVAQRAGLIYVCDNNGGIRRQRCGRGFVYLYPDGRRVRNRSILARIQSLVIPPAWNEVWICPAADGHLQATGRDDRRRKQYLYHQLWQETTNHFKFASLPEFGAMLPGLRKQVAGHLRRQKLDLQTVTALAIQILDLTAMRVGSLEYANDNSTFGLTTLQKRHVTVQGEQVEFRYRGKSGLRRQDIVHSRRLAARVQQMLTLRGRQAFQYLDGDQIRGLSAEDVNAYLQAVTGSPFTAKAFRTWLATVLVAWDLSQLPPAPSVRERKRNSIQAIKRAAGFLGNTVAVCRSSYVHPQLVESYLEGKLADLCRDFRPRRRQWFSRQEQLLQHVLARL